MLGGVDASLADATTISVLLPLLIYQTYMYVYTPVESQHPYLSLEPAVLLSVWHFFVFVETLPTVCGTSFFLRKCI